jgi:hypothetical protein
LVLLLVEKGLPDTAKTLHWLQSVNALYLLATGARSLIQCFRVNLEADGTIGMLLHSQPTLDPSLADLRLVASDLSQVSREEFELACGYSDGSIRVRVCCTACRAN